MPWRNSEKTNPIILIRLMVGMTFFLEGIQKFLYPDTLGVGRFLKIGIPMANVMAPFVGGVEIVCGFLVMVGFQTIWASIPLTINISVAILTTKLPMLMEKGFWAAAHESRTDFGMLLGLIFLIQTGSGKYSVDFARDKETTAKAAA